MVFADNQVQSIIDFTPEYEHELYSLAQFLYWTCLWKAKDTSASKISSALEIYIGSQAQAEPQLPLFLVYLAKACLFRTMGPMLNMLENGAFDAKKVSSRLAAIEAYLDLRGKLLP